MIFNDNSYIEKLTSLVRWGHWYCFANILLGGLLASLYIIADPFPSTLLGTLYLFFNWWGHIAFLGFFIFIITVFPVCFIFPNSHVLRGWGSFVASIGLSFLLLDIWLYFDLGLHLQFSEADLLVEESQLTLSSLSGYRWVFFLVSFIVLLALQLALSNFLWRRLDGLKQHTIGFVAARFLVFSFVCAHLMHIWADAVLYQPIVRQDNMFPLSYPATAKSLMLKHGIIDKELLAQRNKIKLNIRDKLLLVDESKATCPSVEKQQVTLIMIRDLSLQDVQQRSWQDILEQKQLTLHQRHIDTGSSVENSIYNLLTGLPEIYRLSKGQQSSLFSPVLEALNSKLLAYPSDINSLLYFANDAESLGLPLNWHGQQSNFIEQLNQSEQGITLVIVDKSFDLTPLLEQPGKLLITGLSPGKLVPLMSNIGAIDPQQVTGHTDIAPSLYKSVFACQGDVQQMVVGQNMFNPQRSWLVNSHGTDIRLYQGDEVISISANGSYRIKNVYTQQDIDKSLDMTLVTRAATQLHRLFQ